MAPRFADEYDESRWLLKALRETAHELESQLWGLDEEELRRRPGEDAWSLKEIAAHLRDCEEHFSRCLELIETRNNARLPAFDADALVLERDYRDCDLYEAVEGFAQQRSQTVSLLWTGLDWERTGMHPYLGEVSVGQLARRQSEHDLEHLWQARKVRMALEQGAPAR
jgi:uncharacterized damage-inducible protein DinB